MFEKLLQFYSGLNESTHCVLLMPYDDINLGQHWHRKWFVAWWHQAITWTSVDSRILTSISVQFYRKYNTVITWRCLSRHGDDILFIVKMTAVWSQRKLSLSSYVHSVHSYPFQYDIQWSVVGILWAITIFVSVPCVDEVIQCCVCFSTWRWMDSSACWRSSTLPARWVQGGGYGLFMETGKLKGDTPGEGLPLTHLSPWRKQ